MNKSKNKNTPNPSNGGGINTPNNNVSRDRENAIENIKATYPTKK